MRLSRLILFLNSTNIDPPRGIKSRGFTLVASEEIVWDRSSVLRE